MSPGAAAMTSGPGILDVARFITDGLIRPIADGLREVTANFSDTIGGAVARSGADRARARDERCSCEPEVACHCTCCIVDADVVLYAYQGERRVFPLIFENPRRREKNVKLTLDNTFTTRRGNVSSIHATLLPPAEFKLGPCASHAATIVVDTMAAAAGSSTAAQAGAGAAILPDIDDCTVYYTNLKVEGCEIRPLRIAVAILPRDCGAYRVNCRSSGCC
jgi:hypothetical protein